MRLIQKILRYFWFSFGQLFCFYPDSNTELIKKLQDHRVKIVGRNDWDAVGEDFRSVGKELYLSAKKFSLEQ